MGNPIAFTLTGSKQAGITQALTLFDRTPGVKRIQSLEAEAIIPPRSNRKNLRTYDRHRYKARNPIERHGNLLKQFRRVTERYEKLAAHFAAMITCRCRLR
ncbi:MAG: hypothetical protein ACT4P0_10855 [Panacagrimonas sp.]